MERKCHDENIKVRALTSESFLRKTAEKASLIIEIDQMNRPRQMFFRLHA
jgi:hypothetical protein